MDKKLDSDFYGAIKKQFGLRVDKYEDSAGWIKDRGLIDLHRNLTKGFDHNRILDLCCGTGIMGKKICRSSTVVGLDASLDMLKKAKRKLSVCINGLAESMPFRNNSFDVVLCRQALHFLDLERVFKEIYRVCRRGGMIIISQIVPFGGGDESWLLKIHQCKQPLLKNFMNEEDIIKFFKKSGLQNVKTQDHIIRESINRWLKFSPELDKNRIAKVKKLYIDAPLDYKKMHKVKIPHDDISEDMRWIVVKGIKK